MQSRVPIRIGWNRRLTLQPLVGLALLTALLIGCGRREDNPKLATFSGGEVRQSDYIDHYLLSTKYKPEEFPEVERLKEIVADKGLGKITVSEARARGIHEDPTFLALVRKREDVVLFQRYMRRHIIDAVVTDSLIQRFYADFSPQYRMRYILRPVSDESTPRFARQQKDTINFVYRKLQAGGDFEELARRYSHDARTARKGGDLGFVIKESLGDARIREVMDELSEGSYSKPFRGVAGLYILYKGEKRIVPVPPLEKVHGRIWQALYRTRRHDIEKLAEARFEELAPRFHYKVDQSVVDRIRKKAGDLQAKTGTVWLEYEKLSMEDMALKVATFDGGSITVGELFADRRKRPGDMWEFDRRLAHFAQQAVFALHARELGMNEAPEVQEEMGVITDALLRWTLHEREVKAPVAARLDSVRKAQDETLSAAAMKTLLNKKRAEFETEIRGKFEDRMKAKYQFQFVTSNFKQALEEATKRKQEQVEEAKRAKEKAQSSKDKD